MLGFDHEGRPLQFDTWLDDLQLYLPSDSRDSASLFDHTSGTAPAPPAIADSATRSQWLTRDAAARLAIRNHLPLAECTHFGQHRTAQALYNVVVACYSSPATAALGRLLVPYLFPELSAFATVEDLVSRLRTSVARYRAAAPAEFLDRNQPPMFITLYFIVTRLPDSLRSVLLVALRARPSLRGAPPPTLPPSYASVAAIDVPSVENVGAASASAKRRSSKGKGGRGGGGGSSGSGGGGSSGGGGGSGGGGNGGSGGGSGGFGGGGGGGGGGGSGGSGRSGGSGSGGSGGGKTGAQRGGSGGGQRQRQQRPSETPSPQQLREWLFQRGASGGSVSCPYVIGTGERAGQTCGKPHTQDRCFSPLDNAWRAEFGDQVARPHWAELLSAEGDCYWCVPPDPGIEAAAPGASESSLPGSARAEALHTFTLDSGASRCFFRDNTTLTPLPAPVPVGLADPSRGPVFARSSTVLLCLAVPSGSLSGLHLPSFSTNLVSTAALQDSMVTTTTLGGQPMSICTCTWTGRYLSTFTRRLGSSLYILATEPPQVAASAQVSTSGQVAPPCSCLLVLHQTLLWHHRLGHPSLPLLRGMHNCLLVSGLPRSLPPLPPSPSSSCLPCVEWWQRATPISSSFPPTSAPLQTLHMDVWGPARVSGEVRKRYFSLVVDDYTRYTMVFPLHSKGLVVDVLIPWIRAERLQLRERFHQDLLVMRLHSDRGGEFSSDLLPDFCRGEGILQSFKLPDSPQQNGIGERRIGLVMEVARTSMIHAAAPHFLWPFTVQYAAHQLNLWPRVSLPETSPILRWTGEVGDASVLRFYHPTPRRVFPSHDATFDESVLFCRLFPYRSSRPPPPPLFLAPGAARGAASGGAEPGGAESVGARSGGAVPRGAEPGGAEPAGVEPGGAEAEVVEPRAADSEGAESRGAEPQGAASSGGPAGASPRLSPRSEPLSPQQLREWLVRRARLRSGAAGDGATGDNGDPGAGGAGFTAGAGGTGGTVAAGPGGACTRGTGAAETGGVGGAAAGDPTEPGAGAGGAGAGGTSTGGAGAGGDGAVDPGAGGAGDGGAGGTGAGGISPLQPASPLSSPSPYTEQSGSLTKRREPASRPVSAVCSTRRVPRSRPPPVPGTHAMVLRPSSVPLRVPLPPRPESSFPAVPDPESDLVRASSPKVSRLIATVVTDPFFESTVASSLVVELLDFADACRLDYATALVAESASASPPSVGGECALGTDVFEDRQEDFKCLAGAVPRFTSMLLAPEGDPDAPDIPTPRSYAEAITGPYSAQWQAAMDAKMASWKSTSTYIDAVPPSWANIVGGMWIISVKRPPGSLLAFKALYVARGFSHRQGVDYFQTFSPTPKMTTFRVLLHVAAQHDYELHSLDFSTAFLQGSLHKEIWLRRPPGFTGSFPTGLHLHLINSLLLLLTCRCFYTPTSRFRHSTSSCTRDTLALTWVLQRFGFQFSSPQPTPLSTSHLLSAPPSDESVEPCGTYPELVGCLISSCEAEIYAGAMAAQELRWLTYLLTELGKQPRSVKKQE
ncbi:unnamed protein product [Closterium sp. NIES-53]